MPNASNRSEAPGSRRGGASGPTDDASRGPAERQRPGRRSGRLRERLAGAAAAAGPLLRETGGRIASAGPLGIAVLVLGTAGAVLLIVAETLPVVTIEILTGGSCGLLADEGLRDLCSQSGASRHSFALGLLGLLAVLMAWGAGLGRSRPAAAALALAGAAALAVLLIGDLPDVDETGEIGLQFAEAEARAGSGLYLGLAGGALTLVAGIMGLAGPWPDRGGSKVDS